MPQLGSSGIQALVSSFTDKDVDQALKEIALKIARSVDDVNDQLNKISIDKDVVNNLVNQIKALPEEVRKKTQGMSFDLFSDLINADGAEEKIDEAFKTFTNKIQSFVKLRDQIGNDELIIKADYSQIDELIGKTERLLELQKELDKWQSGKSRTKKSINADISSVESEIKSGISNLNVSGGQVGVGVNVDNEALAELDKKIKETEESLKSAREEAEKYGGSLDVLKKKIDQTYNKSIDKDTQKNADNFREAVQNYIKAGGSQKDLDKDYLSWYKLSGESWPKNFIPLNQIANESEEAQQKVQELENALDNLYRQREALSKGVGSNVISSEIDAEKLKEQEQEINKIKESLTKTESQLEQVNQKYAEQSNLVSELENKLKALEGINNPKVIETDEYKNIISELEAAKKKASEFQNEMNELRQTVEVLKSSLSSYNTGDVVPRQDLENANRVIDNLSNKINELETSLTETKNKFALLSEEVTKLQQDKSDLSGQLAQQKEINAAQQEQISNQSKIQAELEKTKNKLNELLTTIAKLQDIQKNAISTIENYGEIEGFKKASKIVGYNEGIDTPENFVNFDYLEKAKQKVQELGKEYDKLDVKASVYYNQYLQKGGTEKIFDANGKDVSNELISLYTEMSSLINQTGDISIETAQKILRSVNSQIYSLNEEKKALQNKNKELEKAVKLEEKATKEKKENQKVQQEQTKTPTAKRSSISQEQFRKDMERERAKAQSNIDNTTGKGTLQVDFSSIVSEQQALEKLEQAIKSVTIAIAEKNKAIQAEEVQMDKSVNSEISKLEELKGKLNEIKSEFENGIASGLFKNTNNEDVDGTSVNVDLKPTVDANKFKEDAERLLAFVDIEKEVNLKVGELNTSNTTDATSTVTSPVFENITNDNVIEEQNKDIEEQQRLYNNIIRLLTEYLSLQDRINSGNRDIASGDLINSNDIRKQTGKVSQRAVKDQLKDYLSISKNENGIYSDKSINHTKNKLAAYVDDFDNAEKAAEIFGNKNKELFNEITQMINDAKVSLDAYNEAQLNIDVVKDQLVELNKLQSGEKLTFGQLWDLEKVVKTDGLEAGLKYITDELGIKIPEAAQKSESAIAEVNNELSKPQQLQQQPQFKPIESDTGNDQEDKKSDVITVPVEPLLVQSEWEVEIDKILNAIGTKKIKIEPDISSEAWNNFKTFVDNISKQVINLKVVDRESYGLPSDLKASYTNSTKYITELYKIEEKIAQAKETGNKKDLERLATLEAEKKKYEDLLNLEKQFRSDDRFKDFDTTSQENALNKLISTKMQEYQSNRQVAAVKIEEEAYNENQKFDENKRLEEATALLEQQKVKWEEIQNIKIKISTLDPVNDVDEINNLNAQKSNLESELSTIEKELNLYDSLIDKKKQSNELDKIASNANKQVNDNTLERVNKLYNDYVNNISEQSQLELKGTDRTDEEEQRLVQLRQEYLDLTEKVNIALTEEQNKTTAISKVLESIKIAQDLGVSGILRNNDIDQGYEQANKINNALNTTSQRMNDIKKQGQTDFFGHLFSNAENEISDLNNKLVNNKITLTEYGKEVGRIQSLLSKQTNAVALINSGDMDEVSTQMKEIASQIPGIQADTIKWSNGNKTLTALIKDQNNEWKKLTLNAQTASGVITRTFTTSQAPATSLSKLLDELGSKFRNLTAYILSFVSFYEIWAQIKQGVTYVKELDSAFTEMRKVSDETTESLKEFQKESFDIADSVASTAKEIQNSTADWLRLGYAMDEASELARTTAVYKAVGDDMDIVTATESMVSTLQGFQLEADQAANIVDQFNEVSNNFAIDSKGIGAALQRSAASFNAANTGLSESISLITATNAVLQDPEKVGM